MATKSRTPKNHILKCETENFNNVWCFARSFDIRNNYRAFQVLDNVTFLDYNSKTKTYGSRSIRVKILYILSDFIAMKKGYICFSFVVESLSNNG